MFSAGLAAAVADEYCERAAIHSFAGFRGNKKTWNSSWDCKISDSEGKILNYKFN